MCQNNNTTESKKGKHLNYEERQSIKSNFKHSFEKTVSQSIDSHTLERYGIENNISTNIEKNGNISREKLSSYAISLVSYLGNDKKISIYIENEKIYSNIDIDEESLTFLSKANEYLKLLFMITIPAIEKITEIIAITDITIFTPNFIYSLLKI